MPPNCLPRQWEGMMMREKTSNSTFKMPALMLQQIDRIVKQNRTETTTTGSTPETCGNDDEQGLCFDSKERRIDNDNEEGFKEKEVM